MVKEKGAIHTANVLNKNNTPITVKQIEAWYSVQNKFNKIDEKENK